MENHLVLVRNGTINRKELEDQVVKEELRSIKDNLNKKLFIGQLT